MYAKNRQRGFTLIELLVVLAIIALLLTLAVPRYFQTIDASKETILISNLQATRDAIDKFYGDTGKYPDTLADLVNKKYLRSLPMDPITQSTATWILIAPDDQEKGNVYNIKSGAPGQTHLGQSFSSL
ncbi:type II secretion system protein [Solimicrobium silvestre]|uniref:Prepilin-type N-terminal cleavage/methylation domain n=1 Tax=Solimicrobium silvestre TaxID=2099400 RepID=A0A2S9GYA2_9BURK|nr:prepilin-type N-terminal cleavage/methylation domain-containing protein [Solimicrobium silvestre]PRC92693.1 Prepilin-type N-terminal cleavage/methylation domain [Solimicrobium silvestre]